MYPRVYTSDAYVRRAFRRSVTLLDMPLCRKATPVPPEVNYLCEDIWKC